MSFPSRFPGRCARCATPICTGDLIDYDKATKSAWHTGCRDMPSSQHSGAVALPIATQFYGLSGPGQEPVTRPPRAVAPRATVTDDQIRTIVEGLVMPEEERAILLKRLFQRVVAQGRARYSTGEWSGSTGERTTVTIHTLCCRCGGSAKDGRPMAHRECWEQDDVPF